MKHERLALTGFQLLAAALAWHLRFVQDDAFISFHYARNLVEGLGLTWFGVRVEGYSNFLWVVWCGIGIELGVDPVHWAWASGIAAFVATLELLFRLARRLFPTPSAAWLAAGVFATNFTMLSYATGGLGTMAQAALVCGAILLVHPAGPESWARPTHLAALSLTGAAAVLLRLDSALPVAIAGSVAAIQLARNAAKPAVWAAFLLPFAMLIGGWLAWKLSYYGGLLPNPFYAKVGGWHPNGLLYLRRFADAYWLSAAILLTLAANLPIRRRWWRWTSVCWTVLLGWCGYVVWVGGDFMEFRFLVPVGALGSVLLAGAVTNAARRQTERVWLVAVGVWLALAAGSHEHATTFRGTTDDDALDSIEQLATFYGHYPDGDFRRLGDALGRDLEGSGVRLATHAVGALPYYSRLETVDMFGLNDVEIAREGRVLDDVPYRPGHRVHATLGQLEARDVHLVVGHPVLAPEGWFAKPAGATDAALRAAVEGMVVGHDRPIEGVSVVYAPIDGESGLVLWYLTPHPAIETQVASGRWWQRRLSPRGSQRPRERSPQAPLARP